MDREEALEVALLAKAVGSHLVGVDQMTVERSNSGGNANKINMENFLAPFLGKQARPQNHESGASSDMIKAYQGLNELALQSFPDIGNEGQPASNINGQQPQLNIVAGSPISASQTQQSKKSVSSLLTRSDIDSVRNSLKGIDKSLVALLNYMKNSKK
jgi:hypothetical protein